MVTRMHLRKVCIPVTLGELDHWISWEKHCTYRYLHARSSIEHMSSTCPLSIPTGEHSMGLRLFMAGTTAALHSCDGPF